jgi:hypothetical protein
VNSHEWNAAIYGHHTSWLPNGFSLTMSPQYTQIGEKLAGQSGASADAIATFTNNQYASVSDAVYHYQFQNGSFNAGGWPYNPPYAGWSVEPSQSSTGGKWWATTY